MGLFAGCDWKNITYLACLEHDIAYYFGRPGDTIEKHRVDLKFKSDLISKSHMKAWLAELFYRAVRTFGKEEFGIKYVSWAFGLKGKTNE